MIRTDAKGTGNIPKIPLGTSNLLVSKVCLGTMTFGDQNSESESFSLLDYAVERGINFIDTAEIYPVKPQATTQGLSATKSYWRPRLQDRLVSSPGYATAKTI